MDKGIPRLLLEGRPGSARPPWPGACCTTEALRRRPDIRVVRVTEATRDALPEQLIDYLVRTPRSARP